MRVQKFDIPCGDHSFELEFDARDLDYLQGMPNRGGTLYGAKCSQCGKRYKMEMADVLDRVAEAYMEVAGEVADEVEGEGGSGHGTKGAKVAAKIKEKVSGKRLGIDKDKVTEHDPTGTDPSEGYKRERPEVDPPITDTEGGG